MKINGRLQIRAVAIVIVALALALVGNFSPGDDFQFIFAANKAPGAVASTGVMPLGLPSQEEAKAVLNASVTIHHPHWVDVPMGRVRIKTFVIYPDLKGRAPVVMVTANAQGMSDWVRAVGSEVVNHGFIAVVPDVLSGLGPDGGGTNSFANHKALAAALDRLGADEIDRRMKAVRDYFVNQPGSNGKSVILDFRPSENRLDAAINTPTQWRVARFDLSEHAWHNTLAVLANLAEPASPQANPAASEAAAAIQRQAQQAQQEIARRGDIVPDVRFAMRVAEESPRKGAWVNIPATTSKGAVKVHAWLVQPAGNDKAPVVVVIHPGPGMDLGQTPQKGKGAYWMRAVADRLAAEGFIAVVPDMASGLGPNNGNFDSFKYPDDMGKALQSRSVADRLELVKAARDYAIKLPRSNGKSGVTGFCNGGGMAWESTAAIPGVNAAVSFYGGPPALDEMAKIQAPVLAFAGEFDPGLAASLPAAAPDMQRLGKAYEFKVYPATTHAFLDTQAFGLNSAAALDSWPRAIAFFNRYLKNTETSGVKTR